MPDKTPVRVVYQARFPGAGLELLAEDTYLEGSHTIIPAEFDVSDFRPFRMADYPTVELTPHFKPLPGNPIEALDPRTALTSFKLAFEDAVSTVPMSLEDLERIEPIAQRATDRVLRTLRLVLRDPRIDVTIDPALLECRTDDGRDARNPFIVHLPVSLRDEWRHTKGFSEDRWDEFVGHLTSPVFQPHLGADLLLEARTFTHHNNFPAAVLYAALAVEALLFGAVARALEDRGFPKEEARAVANGMHPRALTDILKTRQLITISDAKQIKDLGDSRGGLVHPKTKPTATTEADARDAIRLGYRLLDLILE